MKMNIFLFWLILHESVRHKWRLPVPVCPSRGTEPSTEPHTPARGSRSRFTGQWTHLWTSEFVTRFKAVRRTSDVSFRVPLSAPAGPPQNWTGKKTCSCSVFNEQTWSGVSLRMMSLQTVTNGRTSTFWFTAEHLSRVLHPDRNQDRFYISPPETIFTYLS